MVIYIDVLFLRDFILSFLVLLIVGELLKEKYMVKKLVEASIISSIITIVLMAFDLDKNVILKLASIVITSIIAFGYNNTKCFLTNLGGIITITFLIGGVFSSSLKKAYEIIPFGIIAILAIKKYIDFYKVAKWKARNIYKLETKIEDEIISFKAFLDTGNFLTAGVFEEPVIVLSRNAISGKISEKLEEILAGKQEENYLKDIISVGIKSIDGTTKYQNGVRVKQVIINNNEEIILEKAVIILSNQSFKEYDALIGLNALEGGIENGNASFVKSKNKEIFC